MKTFEAVNASAGSAKKCTLYMCKAVLLLMAITFLGDFFGNVLTVFVRENVNALEQTIMKIFALLGAEKGAALTGARLVFSGTSFSRVLSLVTSFVSLAVPCMLFAKIENISWKMSFDVGGKFVKSLFPMFCLCHMFTTLASVFSGSLGDFMLPGSNEVYRELTGVVARDFNIYDFVINILCTCVFVPIVEEYAFRGVIFSYLRRGGASFGVVASAVIFGIAHMSPVQSVYAFTFGIFSALLVYVTGNIKTSILFHAANNFLTVVLGYIMGAVDEVSFTLISSVYLMVTCAVGLYGLYVFCKDGGVFDTFRKKAEAENCEKTKNPGMKQIMVLPLAVYIAYYVYCVLSAVM